MKPARDSAYLKYIRSLSCTVCSSTTGIDAHHFGPHGMSQKASDYETLPLCRHHHRYFHELGARRFAERYELDIPAIIKRLQAKPRLTIESGSIVATIENEEYIVGPVSIGMQRAVTCALQLWWQDRKDVAS